jgi:hypothetical protein
MKKLITPSFNKWQSLDRFGTGSHESDNLRITEPRQDATVRIHHNYRPEVNRFNDPAARYLKDRLIIS